nr:ribonuclease H-like domain-containing protein [Tanacetum cinerariifolium]
MGKMKRLKNEDAEVNEKAKEREPGYHNVVRAGVNVVAGVMGFSGIIICDLNKTPDLSKQSPQNCPKCGHPVNGHYCQGCALLRKKFKEDLFISCVKNGILQDSFEPSNDNPNVVNAPQEPFVINQDPGKNSSQCPPQINHHCCYGCGDPLRGIFCHHCTCKLCGNGAHYDYNCSSKVPIILNPKPFNNQTIKEFPPTVQSFDPKSDLVHNSPNVFDPPSQLPFYSCEFCENDARYGHYCTPQATKSDEVIKSSVENLVPIPSESEGEHECDVSACEVFTTFSNTLFDSDYNFYSSDDQSSFSDEDFPKKIYSNPLFDEEIISMKTDHHHFNAESDLIESMLNHDSSIISSSKIDSLFDEFASELTLLKSIPPGIDETDCYPEEETHFIKRLLYDNSSPRPPEEFFSANSNAAIESFSPSLIPVEDNDSLMEEIDLSFTSDYPMPPGIEEDDYDSERDILIFEELLSNDSLSLPKNESFHFDIPSSFRPSAKPPDKLKIYQDLDPNKWYQSQTKARTLLLQSLPEDHMADFHHLDDAREIWLAVKARFGGNEESKKMRKTMLKLEFSEFHVSEEECTRDMIVALTLKTRGGLEYLSFDDLYNKVRSLKIDVKGGSSYGSSGTVAPTHSTFIGATSTTTKMGYSDQPSHSSSITYTSAHSVALTLKTRGGLEYLSFDDLYNKLRSLEFDVKGGSSYSSRNTAIAPTHFAFIGAASTNTKMVYSDQPSYSSSISYTSVPAGNIMKDVLYSFVAENEPTQQLAYKDFEQVDQLEMEELDIKWQMAMLSLRINKIQKKAGRKIYFNNKDSAGFDRKKARCYNYLQLGHFARECNVKKVDEKARYSTFKISKVKTEEPKAMVSVDSMLNWNEHDAENKTEEADQVFGLMAGFEADFAVPAGNAVGGVNLAAAEFSMMGISPKVQTCPFGCDSKLSDLKKNYEHLEKLYNDSFIQVQAYKNTVKTFELQKDWYHKTQLALEEKVRILSANLENTTNTLKYSETLYDQAKIEKKEWEVKFVESLARFDKWKASSKNLAKLINSSMTTKTKLGIGFKEYFGSDEVFDLSTPSIFDPEPVTREAKSLYERFVKAGDMHEVPPSITGTFMPPSSNPVLEETQVTFGSKSPTSFHTSEANDFVSCDNSDKSLKSKTHDFASCGSSPLPADSFSTVDVKILPKSDVKDPSPTHGVSSCFIQENVNPPSDLCNKRRIAGRNNCNNNFVRTKTCFVYGSKSHLIKDCHVYDTVDNFPSIVLKAVSVPAGSRDFSASTPAGSSIPAASRNRSTSIHAGSSIHAASRNRSAFIHAGISIPAASRNRPAAIHAGRHIPAGRSNKLAPFPAGLPVPTGWDDEVLLLSPQQVHPHANKDIGIVDSGCSRSMTGNKEKLADFVQVKGGTVTFGGGDGKITGKGTVRTSKLDFENVYYVEELQNFNMFSVSQICDKKNKVLFTDAECLVLSKEFQLPAESQVVLQIPRRHDLYTFKLSDIQPEQHLNCLLAKASLEVGLGRSKEK